MVQIVVSVKNTFVHVNVEDVDMSSNARRRTSSAPARVAPDAADIGKQTAHKLRAHGREELLLLPHDEDDYTSMHAHPGPSPFDMDVEGMLGCRVPDTDSDDDFREAKVEARPDGVNSGIDIDDTLSEEMEDCSAFAPARQRLTCGLELPSDSLPAWRAHHLPCLSTAPMTPHEPPQRRLFSTLPIPPREAQGGSYVQSYSGNLPARVLRDAKHEETQGEEKRTTVMLMNVPLRYTSSKLMSTLDSEGFAGMYDFIYVPMAVARSSKGYAFLNCVNPSVAQRFLDAFDGFSGWSTASKNVGRAIWAREHQGLQTNIDRYRNSTVLGKTVPDEYKPRIFKNGVEIPFPPPIRKAPVPTRRAGKPRRNRSQQTISL